MHACRTFKFCQETVFSGTVCEVSCLFRRKTYQSLLTFTPNKNSTLKFKFYIVCRILRLLTDEEERVKEDQGDHQTHIKFLIVDMSRKCYVSVFFSLETSLFVSNQSLYFIFLAIQFNCYNNLFAKFIIFILYFILKLNYNS